MEPGIEIPEVLKKRLVFGDPNQIAALKSIKRQIEEQEERTRLLKEGEVQRYCVEISYFGSTDVEVWATTESEAIEVAEELVDPFEIDFEIDHSTAFVLD